MSEIKPREWWITDNGYHVADEKCDEHDIHVIEYSAYEQLKKEVDRLKIVDAACDVLEKKNQEHIQYRCKLSEEKLALEKIAKSHRDKLIEIGQPFDDDWPITSQDAERLQWIARQHLEENQ